MIKHVENKIEIVNQAIIPEVKRKPRVEKNPRASKFPFADLGIGQTMIVHPGENQTLEKLKLTLASNGARKKAQANGAKFKIYLDGENNTVNAVRVG